MTPAPVIASTIPVPLNHGLAPSMPVPLYPCREKDASQRPAPMPDTSSTLPDRPMHRPSGRIEAHQIHPPASTTRRPTLD